MSDAHAIRITRRSPRWGDRLAVGLLALCAVITILVTVGIVVALAGDALRFFGDVPIGRFLAGREWAPAGGKFGLIPLLNGSLLIALGALVVGVPLGLATAIYLAEYARPIVRSVLKPTLELLAGVPTVVVGFFALQFITPHLLRPLFGDDRVFIFNAASGAIGVGLMVLPVIASISEDAMRAVPQALRDGAYAMGASRRVVALRVVVPAALSGIAASVLLALSRAVGETMIVTIAAGNTPRMTANYFESIQTLTASIAQTVSGEVAAGTTRYRSLFALGLTLFLLTFAMNIASTRIVNRFRQRYQ